MQSVKYSYPIDERVASKTTVETSFQLINESLIGVSRWAETARRLVSAYAAQDNAVVLEGEQGTGKKLVATLIHRCSARRDGPFVSIALGAKTEGFARAMLFGSPDPLTDDGQPGEKGLLELVRKGTLYVACASDAAPLFGDDVARLIEQSRFSSHDGGRARIILGWQIDSGFRRSNMPGALRNAFGFEPMCIPPLRERADDIEALVVHFIKQNCRQTGKELRTLSPEVVNALRSYDWPNNVAELKTLANRLTSQSHPPSIDVSLLPGYMLDRRNANRPVLPPLGLDLANEVKQYERELICAALKQSGGLQVKAARLLRTRATTLFMKIQRYGIDVEEFK
jgi:DNA-binding NtrC family response regulator